jgi:hypothetical protein
MLNFNKTNYVQFMAKPKLAFNIHISYKDNFINDTYSTNFLGLTLDSTLSWKTHIDQLSSKLNSACFIIRSLRPIISTKNLRKICFSYVHSIIAYGIIFWSNSPYLLTYYILTYLLTPWSRVFLEKLISKFCS